MALGSSLGESRDSGRHSTASEELSIKSQFLSIASTKGSRYVFSGGQSIDIDGRSGVHKKGTTRYDSQLLAGGQGWVGFRNNEVAKIGAGED